MQQYAKIDTPEIVSALFIKPAEPLADCPENAEDVEFVMEDQIRLLCRLYPAGKEAPTLLFFPTGRQSINKYNAIAENYVQYGINLLVVSYRGCGKSEGNAGICSIIGDLPFILRKTVNQLQEKKFKGPLFVMGESVGSVFAIETAHVCSDDIKGIIMESGFCDTIPFLIGSGLDISKIGISETDGFNNKDKIENIKLPTLILHGARDTVVVPAQAETLQASSGARNKQFFIIPGAEHDTVVKIGGALYFQTIKTFIDTVSGVNTWRQRRRGIKK